MDDKTQELENLFTKINKLIELNKETVIINKKISNNTGFKIISTIIPDGIEIRKIAYLEIIKGDTNINIDHALPHSRSKIMSINDIKSINQINSLILNVLSDDKEYLNLEEFEICSMIEERLLLSS